METPQKFLHLWGQWCTYIRYKMGYSEQSLQNIFAVKHFVWHFSFFSPIWIRVDYEAPFFPPQLMVVVIDGVFIINHDQTLSHFYSRSPLSIAVIRQNTLHWIILLRPTACNSFRPNGKYIKKQLFYYYFTMLVFKPFSLARRRFDASVV